MKSSKIFLGLMITVMTIVLLILLSGQVKAENNIDQIEFAIDEEGTLTISGTGIIGEGIDKIREVSSYPKDVGSNNISEDSDVIISEFWNREEVNIEMLDIKKVILQEGITGIESDFFNQCDNLTVIEIPSTVTYIGDKAFHYLYGLQEIKVDESNLFFSSENGVLFNKDKTELICYPKGKEDLQYAIPEGVTNIKEIAFANNGWLKTVEVPETVTYIGNGAFRSCYALENFTVAETNSKYIAIDGILFNKNITELICYPSDKEGNSYTVPETVKSIKEYAFSNSYYLQQVDISTIEEIERGAFYWSQLLEMVKLPEKVTYMGTAVFSGCNSLEKVVLPEGITKIEACTFADCYTLEEVTFPQGITEIGDYAFVGSASLTKLVVPMGVTKIGKQVFQNCFFIEELYIPNTVTEIGSLGLNMLWADIYCKSGTVAEKYLKEEGYSYKIDDIAPITMVTYSELDKTKGPVNVTIRALENVLSVEGWQTTLQGMKLTKSYSENVEETVILTDLVGNVSKVNVKVENIDNIAPKVVATYQKGTEETGVQVTLIGDEELQELEGWILSEDKKELVKQYSEPIKEQVIVKDLVGNETTVDIAIVDFVAEVTYSSEEVNQEKVDVTITANRELQELEGWTLSEDKKSLTKEFRENVKWAVTISDIDGNTTTVKVEVNNVDNVPPEITVNYATTEPTKENILVTLTANEPIQLVDGWELSENKLVLTKEYNQNTEEEIEVKDLFGNIQKVAISIQNYDATPANVEVSYNRIGEDDKQIEVTLTADEELQELEGWTLSEDKKELTKLYMQKTTEEIIVKDLAGNQTTVPIEIGDFLVSLTYSITEKTKEDVVVTIQSDTTLQELEGWTLSGDKFTLTKSYQQNTQELLTVKDTNNNAVVVRVQISNIDKTSPVTKVEYSEKGITNQDILVAITADEPMQTVEGWTLSEDGLTLTKTYTQNTMEEIVLKDLVGNESNVVVIIGNIDKESPEVQLTYERKYYNPDNEEEGYQTIVTITANEILQEIEGWELSADGKTLTRTYEENTQEVVVVKDIVGNVTNVNIDIGELELEVNYHAIGSSPVEIVVVSIVSNRELKPLEGWELSEDKKTLTKSYAENIDKYITVEDITGNVAYVEVLITNIGKSAMKGDINLDGKIDAGDLLSVLRHIAASKDEEVATKHPDWILEGDKFNNADINVDQKVDVTDTLKIQRHIAAEKSELVQEKHPDWMIKN